MPYTREGLLAQAFVALGQGTGPMRISHSACRAFGERYAPRIDDAMAGWETKAVQVLERMRAIGRTAAAQAAVAGENVLSAGRLTDAARRVESLSMTELCPPDPYALSPSADVLAKGYTREGILAQVFTAFGQGTGAIRVAHDACLALRERYEPFIDADLLDTWAAKGYRFSNASVPSAAPPRRERACWEVSPSPAPRPSPPWKASKFSPTPPSAPACATPTHPPSWKPFWPPPDLTRTGRPSAGSPGATFLLTDPTNRYGPL